MKSLFVYDVYLKERRIRKTAAMTLCGQTGILEKAVVEFRYMQGVMLHLTGEKGDTLI